MELKHESKPSGLRVNINSGTSDIDYSISKKKFRSSHSGSASSSPDSPLVDPFSKYELNEDSLSDIKHEENITSIKPVPTMNQKPPPSQTMERPLGSTYRIPSHVFARTKSTAPVEWSVASNESLFSIHPGDSSFGRESIFYYNTNIVPDKVSESKEEEVAVEMVKSDENLSLTPSASTHSNLSDMSAGSTQSFAFPILIGNNGKDGSTKIEESVRIGFNHSSQQLTPTTPKEHPLPQPQQKSEQSEASPPIQSSWLGLFTCCTLCSK